VSLYDVVWIVLPSAMIWATVVLMRRRDHPETDTRAARPRSLRIAFYASCVLWFGFHGPLRRMTAGMSPGLDAILGVIPSFFAAVFGANQPITVDDPLCEAAELTITSATNATVAFYMGKHRPLRAAAFGAACVAATEIIQTFGLPNYTFDLADIAAGILGAVAVVPLMWRHKPRR